MKYGYNFLNLASDKYNSLSEQMRYAVNKEFIDQALARGDQIRLALGPDGKIGKTLAVELEYLKSLGYEFVDNVLTKVE